MNHKKIQTDKNKNKNYKTRNGWRLHGEVPEGNGPRDDKLLAGQDEFRSPDESDEVDPPEVFCQTLWNILNCHKSFGVVGHWGAYNITKGIHMQQ